MVLKRWKILKRSGCDLNPNVDRNNGSDDVRNETLATVSAVHHKTSISKGRHVREIRGDRARRAGLALISDNTG
jgi:hypothetical protein